MFGMLKFVLNEEKTATIFFATIVYRCVAVFVVAALVLFLLFGFWSLCDVMCTSCVGGYLLFSSTFNAVFSCSLCSTGSLVVSVGCLDVRSSIYLLVILFLYFFFFFIYLLMFFNNLARLAYGIFMVSVLFVLFIFIFRLCWKLDANVHDILLYMQYLGTIGIQNTKLLSGCFYCGRYEQYMYKNTSTQISRWKNCWTLISLNFRVDPLKMPLILINIPYDLVFILYLKI